MPRIDPVGETIDNRFRIDSPLGEGGFAAVYLAEQLGMNRNVAVKFLHMEAMADDDLLERFNREAKILATLNHKNIVACYGYGLWRNRIPYLVLEYLEGETLHHKLAREKCLLWDEAFRYGIEVCEALAELHRNQIIHRDLKPENVMLTSDGRVKIIDFGLAAVDGQRLTQAGTLVGSLFYLSPEQATASPLTPSSDIYALGCVLYHAIAGVQPFDGTVPVEVLYKHVNEQPLALNELAHSPVPKAVAAVISIAMRKEPETRFRSATEFGASLESALQDVTCAVSAPEMLETRPKSSAVRRSISSVATVVPLVLIAIACFGALSTLLFGKLNEVKREKAALQVRDDLAIAHLNYRITPAFYSAMITWQELSTPGMVIFSPSAESGRTGSELERTAAINQAVALAASEKLGDELSAEVLVSQLKGWFSLIGTQRQGDVAQWLEKAKALLSGSALSDSLRSDLEFLVRVVEGRQYLQQMNQILPQLIANIYGEGYKEIDPVRLATIEEKLSSIFRSTSNNDILGTPLETRPLHDYAILLAGTHRGTEALTLLRSHLTSGKLTAESKSSLEDALVYAEIARGSSQDALNMIHDLLQANTRSHSRVFVPHLTALADLGLRSDVRVAEAALRLWRQERGDDAETFLPRASHVAAMYKMQGRYKEALAELKKISAIVRNKGSADWSFCYFRLHALTNIANGNLPEAEKSLQGAAIAIRNHPSWATPGFVQQLDGLKSLLSSEVKLKQLESEGKGNTREACALRMSFPSGTFYDHTAFGEQRALKNLSVVTHNPKIFSHGHIWQCLYRLLAGYDKSNSPEKAIRLHSQYQSVLAKFSKPGRGRDEAIRQWYKFQVNFWLSRAFYRAGQYEKALKLSLVATTHYRDADQKDAVLRTGFSKDELVTLPAQIACAAKSSYPAESADLAALVAESLHKGDVRTQSTVESATAVAEILSQGGFEGIAEKLFSESDDFYASRKELAGQLLVMRRHCSALCKAGRYAEADKVAGNGLVLIGESRSPLLKVFHDEFMSIQKFHKL